MLVDRDHSILYGDQVQVDGIVNAAAVCKGAAVNGQGFSRWSDTCPVHRSLLPWSFARAVGHGQVQTADNSCALILRCNEDGFIRRSIPVGVAVYGQIVQGEVRVGLVGMFARSRHTLMVPYRVLPLPSMVRVLPAAMEMSFVIS